MEETHQRAAQAICKLQGLYTREAVTAKVQYEQLEAVDVDMATRRLLPDPDSEDEQWLGTKGAAEGNCRVPELRRQEVELIEVHLEEAITDLAKVARAAESAHVASESNALRQKPCILS